VIGDQVVILSLINNGITNPRLSACVGRLAFVLIPFEGRVSSPRQSRGMFLPILPITDPGMVNEVPADIRRSDTNEYLPQSLQEPRDAFGILRDRVRRYVLPSHLDVLRRAKGGVVDPLDPLAADPALIVFRHLIDVGDSRQLEQKPSVGEGRYPDFVP